jgi:acetylornithine/N-succinyldiaminopimelate aminotransferase
MGLARIMSSSILSVYNRHPVAFVAGRGARLTAEDGSEYLDFGSGVGVNALGHAHPHLVKALSEQAARLWHTSNLYRIPEGERLAKRLVQATFADAVFFTNSGVEALECAFKMARRFHYAQGQGRRYRLITFEGAFHGRTLAAIAAGGQAKYLEGFGPPVDGFDQVPFGDLDAVEAAIGEETAGILLEPVQGEGGMRKFSNQELRRIRELCDRSGLLLVLDEVQCGMARTGRLFAHEAAGITPDIMAIAKAIGGGFPLGACLATEEVAKAMPTGSHGSTYGGNPLAMAVGNAVLDVVLAEGFLEGVRRSSLRLRQHLARLRDSYPGLIEEIRGEGLMIGLKCTIPNLELVQAAMQEHLLTIAAGDNVVRLLPPLVLSDDEIGEGMERLDRALARLARAATPAAIPAK